MSTEFENKFYERHKMSFLRWLMLNCGDLGPCPFCGLERKIKDDWAHLRIQPIFRSGCKAIWFQVACMGCGVKGYRTGGVTFDKDGEPEGGFVKIYDGVDAARKAWNRRNGEDKIFKNE